MPRITNLFLLLLCAPVAFCGARTLPPAPTGAPAPTIATIRIVQHALGESTITGTPQRIVALEWTYVEDLLGAIDILDDIERYLLASQ